MFSVFKIQNYKKRNKSASEWPGESSEGSDGRPNNPAPAAAFDYHDKQVWTIGIVQSGRTERTRVFSRLDLLFRFASRQN